MEVIDRNELCEELNDFQDSYIAYDSSREQFIRPVIAYIKDIIMAQKYTVIESMKLGYKTRTEISDNDDSYYIINFDCAQCNENIAALTYNKERLIGKSTICKSNIFPEFCPFCGQKLSKIKI